MKRVVKAGVAALACLCAGSVAAAGNDSVGRSSQQASCFGDCVVPSLREQEGMRAWAEEGYTLRDVAIFLDEQGNDPRTLVTPEDDLPGLGIIKAYAPVGDKKQFSGIGTATLINECLIITNKHVVSDETSNLTNFIFEAGIQQKAVGVNPQNASYAHIIESGNYNDNDNSTFHEDWAILKIDRNLGEEFGYQEPLFLPESDATKLQNLTSSGIIEDDLDPLFITDGNISLKKHSNCSAKGFDENVRFPDQESDGTIFTGGMMTNCSSMPGSSGGSVSIKRNGKTRMIGVTRNGYTREKERKWDYINTNVYVPFISKPTTVTNSLTQERLERIIREHPCTIGTP
ncbi:MAG: trypsin-like serine protease [Lysobacterales bacterium]